MAKNIGKMEYAAAWIWEVFKDVLNLFIKAVSKLIFFNIQNFY